MILSMLLTCWLLSPASAGEIKGYVLKVEENKVYMDLGRSSHVAPGQEFIIYREGEELKHPVSGTSLGFIENTLGSGRILEIHENYSLGEILTSTGPIAVGTKIRSISRPTLPTSLQPTPTPDIAAEPRRQPLLRSPLLNLEAVDIAVGDIDGDGTQEVLLAGKKTVQAFPLDKAEWKPSCQFEETSAGARILSLEVADLDKDGREEVFVTLHNGVFERAESYVLVCKDGAFNKTASLPWMIRSFQDESGQQSLAAQQLLADASFPFSNIYELQYAEGRYVTSKKPLKYKRLDWIYSFSLSYQEKSPLVVFYSATSRIRLQFPKGSWYTPEAFGQTANRLPWHGKLLHIHPRLISENGPQGLAGVYTVKNIPRFGALSSAFGWFNRCELRFLSFNGISLDPSWQVELGGYAAGLALRPGDSRRQAELLVALVSADGRTSVLSFRK